MSGAEQGPQGPLVRRLVPPRPAPRQGPTHLRAVALALLPLMVAVALPDGTDLLRSGGLARAAALFGHESATSTRAPSVRGETGFLVTLSSTPPTPPLSTVALTGRIELGDGLGAGAHSGGLEWRITANPTWQLTAQPDSPSARPGPAGSAPFEWALEEAYLAVRRAGWILSAGRERLPLEVARLSLPFSVEPVGPGELRLGVQGIRLTHLAGTARLRLAVLWEPSRLTPAVSWRWQGGPTVWEGHALLGADRGQPVTAGLSASEAVGNLVAYGEVWYAPDWRYIVGLSGFWHETLWTVEAGRASPAPGERVRQLVAAQLAWQQGTDIAWSVTPYAFLDEDRMSGRLVVERTFVTGPHEVRLFGAFNMGSEPPAWSVGAGYRYFWGTGVL